MQNTIASSARYGGYSYQEYSGKEGIKKILQLRPTNTLILINNPIDREGLGSLAFHNDLVYIDSYHPFEQDPSSAILFSGQTLDIASYKAEYELHISSLQKYIRTIHASYIRMSTEEDIVRVMNLFFKKRYTNG